MNAYMHGFGGGTGMNFRVRAYASEELLPATERENTIAVITDQKITQWEFSPSAPGNPVEGMVWFLTGTTSPAAFNALKKNSVMIYPLSAKQYVGGSWIDKTAKSYLNGVLVDWIPAGALIWEGKDCTALTGGWVAEGKKYGDASAETPTAPTVTQDGKFTDIRLSASGQSGNFRTKNKISLTGFTKIVATGEFCNKSTSSHNGLVVWSSMDGTCSYDNRVAEVNVPEGGVVTELSLPINLTGEYYVGFFLNSYGGAPVYAKVGDIELE